MRFLLFMFITSLLHGADWLYIQGTERCNPATGTDSLQCRDKPNIWGFVQLKYEENHATPVISGGVNKTGFAYVKPDLQHQKEFNLYRARLGVRGMFDNQNKTNYFILTEFGRNGVTDTVDSNFGPALMDASVTFRHVDEYANLRTGLFKYPGSEEGLQARFVSPFILFSDMTNALLLERFNKTAPTDSFAGDTYINRPERGVGAFRDSGIELFKTYKLQDDWALSYALMLGNGSGLSWEHDGCYTGYGYLAAQKSLGGGKGYYTKALKLYSWYQYGIRQLYNNNVQHEYERIRYGLGGTYFNKGLRLEGEFTQAEGMIFTGVNDTNTLDSETSWSYVIEAERKNRSHGYYVSANYEIMKKTELFARYDSLHSMTNNAAKKRIFSTLTLGASYRFKGPTRLDFNYLIRDAKAPDNATAQAILNNIDDIIALQLTVKF